MHPFRVTSISEHNFECLPLSTTLCPFFQRLWVILISTLWKTASYLCVFTKCAIGQKSLSGLNYWRNSWNKVIKSQSNRQPLDLFQNIKRKFTSFSFSLLSSDPKLSPLLQYGKKVIYILKKLNRNTEHLLRLVGGQLHNRLS